MRNCFLRSVASLFIVASACVSQAAIIGPYAPNANTVHLFHFDEAAGSTFFTSAVPGKNRAIPTGAGNNTTANLSVVPAMTGAVAYSPAFGNAANVNAASNGHLFGIGYDGNGNNVYTQDTATASTDRIGATAALGIPATSLAESFTVEAMINLPSIAASGQHMIMSWEGESGNARAFQFRISGGSLTGPTFPQLQFVWVGTTQTIGVPLPLTGSDAFEANQWFHVAFNHTYDTNSNTSTNQLYWTKVDDSRTAASPLGSATVNPNFDNVNLKNGLLVFGNYDSNSAWNSGLRGRIDEVRISNTALGADDFIFSTIPEPSTMLLCGSGIVGLCLMRYRKK